MMKHGEFNEIIILLKELNKEFPMYSLGRHVSTALSEYGDVWGMTNKEFLFSLKKYKVELELDVPHIEGEELEKIIRGGMNLFDGEEEYIDEEEY